MEVALLSLIVLALAGCQTPLTEDLADGARYLYGTTRTRPSGLARFCIDIEDGDAALLVTAQAAEPYNVFVRRLTAPDGEDVLFSPDLTGSDFSKTNAVFVNGASSLNWPIDDTDRTLDPGCWQAEIGVVDEDLEFVDEPADVDVLVKPDDDITGGTLHVALIYTDGTSDDLEAVNAVSEASDIWRTLYAQAGIDLEFSSFVMDENGLLPPAFGEESRWTAIAADTPARTVNVVLSDFIIHEETQILGISGDIPGPLVPTPFSGVQLSMAMGAGTDAIYDEADVRLLAETMAHEVAHFLGLFHPVERDLWSHWDALDDTPDCGAEEVCKRRLGDNLMFPYPVCVNQICTPQLLLTDDQRSVLNRAVAVF